jgi:hypothetical protein
MHVRLHAVGYVSHTNGLPMLALTVVQTTALNAALLRSDIVPHT